MILAVFRSFSVLKDFINILKLKEKGTDGGKEKPFESQAQDETVDSRMGYREGL